MLNFPHDPQTVLNHTTKYDVFAIQMRCLAASQEELTSVLILARVRHTQQTWARMLCDKVFIREVSIINTHDTGSITLQMVFGIRTEGIGSDCASSVVMYHH